MYAEFNTNLGAESGENTSVQVPPYVNALLYRDQIFEEDDREYQPKKPKKEEPSKDRKNKGKKEDPEEIDAEDKDEEAKEKEKQSEEKETKPQGNPFLKPVRLPRNALCLPPACK